jgi:hypothetical protein
MAKIFVLYGFVVRIPLFEVLIYFQILRVLEQYSAV